MKHRFFDIVVEDENGENNLNKEFVLDIPEYDMDSPVERMEYLESMLDSLVEASGCVVCSFRNEVIQDSSLVGC